MVNIVQKVYTPITNRESYNYMLHAHNVSRLTSVSLPHSFLMGRMVTIVSETRQTQRHKDRNSHRDKEKDRQERADRVMDM